MDVVGQLDVSGRIVDVEQALANLRESLELAACSAAQLRTVDNAIQAVHSLARTLRVVETTDVSAGTSAPSPT